jgi:hypothetical protein
MVAMEGLVQRVRTLTWQPPSWGGRALRLSATEAGEHAYSRLFDRT